MFWRIRPAASNPDSPPLIYDEGGHRIRRSDGTWVRLPYNPARIFNLLVLVHGQGRAVSPNEICAFLGVPPRTRIKDHLNELRNKLSANGIDPDTLIERATSETGYRLVTDLDASVAVAADALEIVDGLLASPHTKEPTVQAGLAELRRLMLFTGPLAFGLGLGMLLRSNPDGPNGHFDPEAGQLGRAVLPPPDVESIVTPEGAGTIRREADGYAITLTKTPGHAEPSACFVLPHELALADRDVLAFDLALVSPSEPTAIAIRVEGEKQDGKRGIPFELRPGVKSSPRVSASDIDAAARGHVRRICIGARGEANHPGPGSVAIQLRAVRLGS